MKQHQLRRQLRKELLLLQAEQHRQSLAQEVGKFVRFSYMLSHPQTVADGGASWAERAQWLLSLVLPNRWRKFLVYGLALRKMAQAFWGRR